MPETREIVVTIKNAPSVERQAPQGSPGTTQAEPQSPSTSESSVGSQAKTESQAMATIAVQLAERAAKEAIDTIVGGADYLIQRQFYIKDDYIGQRNYSIAKAQVSSVAGMAIGMGAAIMTGNPLTIGLAVVGLAARVGNNLIDYAKGLDMQELQIRQLDATLKFSRERAGYSLTSGSIGENL